MDFSTLDTRKKSNEGAFLHLKHPGTGKLLYDEGHTEESPKPVGLYMLGRDSDKYAELTHKKNNTLLDSKKKPDEELTSESLEQENIKLVSSLTVGWQNIKFMGDDNFDSEKMPHFFRLFPWAYEQANTFAGDRANFI